MCTETERRPPFDGKKVMERGGAKKGKEERSFYVFFPCLFTFEFIQEERLTEKKRMRKKRCTRQPREPVRGGC